MGLFSAKIKNTTMKVKKISGVSAGLLGTFHNQHQGRLTLQLINGSDKILKSGTFMELRAKAGRRVIATGRELGGGFLYLSPKGYVTYRPIIKKLWNKHKYNRPKNTIDDLDKFADEFYKSVMLDMGKELRVIEEKKKMIENSTRELNKEHLIFNLWKKYIEEN